MFILSYVCELVFRKNNFNSTYKIQLYEYNLEMCIRIFFKIEINNSEELFIRGW